MRVFARLHPALLLALAGASSCYRPPVEVPPPKIVQVTPTTIVDQVKNQVDILFMVDNSPSMSPKQAELRNKFPELIKILDQFGQQNPAWYHIGVVTSDLGAGQYTLGGGQCHPGGDGAKLQGVGAAADSSCQPPSGDLRFIDYNQLNGTSNLPSGTTNQSELETQFNCMAAVGDQGCGFEMQLESVYRALHDDIPENQGFLRDDALLVVVLITDEDDCSAPDDTDLFDPAKTQYGSLLSYRCTNYSIACGAPPALMPYGDSGGNLAPCQDADPSVNQLVPVQKYIDYFTKPKSQGGVKDDPRDVILVDISAPDDLVESILANPSPQPPGPYLPCPGPVDGKSCAVVLQHSCVAPMNTAFFGDPAVRIRQVVRQAAHQQSTSICDTSYQSALEGVGQLIITNIGPGCIDSPFADPSHPDCTVEDVSPTGVSEVPFCGDNGQVTPCWTLESQPICDGTTPSCCNVVCASAGAPGQHFGVSIDRGAGGLPPPGSHAQVECATLVIPKDANGQLPMCGAPL